MIEAGVAQGHKRVTVKRDGCMLDFDLEEHNIKYLHFFALIMRQKSALNSATPHPKSQKIVRK